MRRLGAQVTPSQPPRESGVQPRNAGSASAAKSVQGTSQKPLPPVFVPSRVHANGFSHATLDPHKRQKTLGSQPNKRYPDPRASLSAGSRAPSWTEFLPAWAPTSNARAADSFGNGPKVSSYAESRHSPLQRNHQFVSTTTAVRLVTCPLAGETSREVTQETRTLSSPLHRLSVQEQRQQQGFFHQTVLRWIDLHNRNAARRDDPPHLGRAAPGTPIFVPRVSVAFGDGQQSKMAASPQPATGQARAIRILSQLEPVARASDVRRNSHKPDGAYAQRSPASVKIATSQPPRLVLTPASSEITTERPRTVVLSSKIVSVSPCWPQARIAAKATETCTPIETFRLPEERSPLSLSMRSTPQFSSIPNSMVSAVAANPAHRFSSLKILPESRRSEVTSPSDVAPQPAVTGLSPVRITSQPQRHCLGILGPPQPTVASAVPRKETCIKLTQLHTSIHSTPTSPFTDVGSQPMTCTRSLLASSLAQQRKVDGEHRPDAPRTNPRGTPTPPTVALKITGHASVKTVTSPAPGKPRLRRAGRGSCSCRLSGRSQSPAQQLGDSRSIFKRKKHFLRCRKSAHVAARKRRSDISASKGKSGESQRPVNRSHASHHERRGSCENPRGKHAAVPICNLTRRKCNGGAAVATQQQSMHTASETMTLAPPRRHRVPFLWARERHYVSSETSSSLSLSLPPPKRPSDPLSNTLGCADVPPPSDYPSLRGRRMEGEGRTAHRGTPDGQRDAKRRVNSGGHGVCGEMKPSEEERMGEEQRAPEEVRAAEEQQLAQHKRDGPESQPIDEHPSVSEARQAATEQRIASAKENVVGDDREGVLSTKEASAIQNSPQSALPEKLREPGPEVQETDKAAQMRDGSVISANSRSPATKEAADVLPRMPSFHSRTSKTSNKPTIQLLEQIMEMLETLKPRIVERPERNHASRRSVCSTTDIDQAAPTTYERASGLSNTLGTRSVFTRARSARRHRTRTANRAICTRRLESLIGQLIQFVATSKDRDISCCARPIPGNGGNRRAFSVSALPQRQPSAPNFGYRVAVGETMDGARPDPSTAGQHASHSALLAPPSLGKLSRSGQPSWNIINRDALSLLRGEQAIAPCGLRSAQLEVSGRLPLLGSACAMAQIHENPDIYIGPGLLGEAESQLVIEALATRATTRMGAHCNLEDIDTALALTLRQSLAAALGIEAACLGSIDVGTDPLIETTPQLAHVGVSLVFLRSSTGGALDEDFHAIFHEIHFECPLSPRSLLVWRTIDAKAASIRGNAASPTYPQIVTRGGGSGIRGDRCFLQCYIYDRAVSQPRSPSTTGGCGCGINATEQLAPVQILTANMSSPKTLGAGRGHSENTITPHFAGNVSYPIFDQAVRTRSNLCATGQSRYETDCRSFATGYPVHGLSQPRNDGMSERDFMKAMALYRQLCPGSPALASCGPTQASFGEKPLCSSVDGEQRSVASCFDLGTDPQLVQLNRIFRMLRRGQFPNLEGKKRENSSELGSVAEASALGFFGGTTRGLKRVESSNPHETALVSAKKAASKEAKKEKQLAKARRKEVRGGGSEGEVDDIDELLRKFVKGAASSSSTAGKLVESSQPSPRAACTLTALPSGELFLFGGEFFDGSQVQIFNDAYRWNPTKDVWRKLGPGFSDESSRELVVPAPRCSHQAVYYNGAVYIFGGEFSTVDQFHHFHDLWRYDLKTNAWEELKCTGSGPSARSGHRMVVWRNQLVVFGGFHDTARETRYFNDLHVLSLQSLKWSRVPVPPHAHVPSPRSGVIMASHGQGAGAGILVCGGYYKVKETQRSVEGKMLEDAWWIDMKEVAASLTSKGTSDREGRTVWQKLGKKACLPSLRSGTATVLHKSMVICFGGVRDLEDKGLVLRSIFYNDLHVFDLERRRWHLLKLHTGMNLKKVKKSGLGTPPAFEGKSQDAMHDVGEEADVGSATTAGDSGFEYDEDSDDETFGYYDQDGRLVRIRIETLEPCTDATTGVESPRQDDVAEDISQAEEKSVMPPALESHTPIAPPNTAEEPTSATAAPKSDSGAGASLKPELFPQMQCPLPRLNAALAMNGNDLIVYGGLVEVGKREYTLDDCWAININQRKEWKCLIKGHLDEHPWHEAEDDQDDSSGSDRSGESSASDSDESDDARSSDSRASSSDHGAAAARATVRAAAKRFTRLQEERDFLRAALRNPDFGNDPDSQTLATPNFDETLQQFFARSHQFWTQKYSEASSLDVPLEPKAARREAFVLASARYHAVRPILRRLQRLESPAATSP